MTAIVCSVHFAAVCATVIRPPYDVVVRQFQAKELVSEYGRLSYRLHVPQYSPEHAKRGADAAANGRKLPLLIWLHGMGESGENNRDQLAWLELLELGSDRAQYFVLAMQCPPKHAEWYGTANASEPMDGLERLDLIYQDVVMHNPIDENRVWLAGISQGASACWEYAARHPSRFAAIVPLSTHRLDANCETKLDGVSVWAFQTTGDGESRIQWCRDRVAQIRSEGGRAKLTVLNDSGHDSWNAAFGEFALHDWLVRQSRDAKRRHRQFNPIIALVLVATVFATMFRLRRWGRRSADRLGAG